MFVEMVRIITTGHTSEAVDFVASIIDCSNHASENGREERAHAGQGGGPVWRRLNELE